MKPLVSVCMPAYNTEQYLADCIRSIQAQTYPNWELVIVNDGSTDGSAQLLNWYEKQDKRIKVIHTPNQGIAKARNTAIQASTGDYIAVMDSDDICYKERLKIAYDTLQKTKSDVFYSAYYRGNEKMEIVDGILPPKKWSKKEITIEDILGNQKIPPHVTIVAKRQCFIDNPYRDELRVNDDAGLLCDFWKADYKFCMSKHPLVLVRFHSASTSATKDKEVRAVTERLRKEFDVQS